MPIAVVTGATSPIGSAIVKNLTHRGYDLIMPSHREFDLSDAIGQDAFCEHVKSKTAVVDVLIHNAANFEQNNLSNLTRDHWRSTMALNTEAPLFITKGLLPLLSAAQSPSVVNLVDCMLIKPWKNYLAYQSSKVLLAQLTRSMALELAPKIRVNAVAPGVVNFRSDLSDKIPLGRTATVDEIASAVVYLACDATYTTGQILTVDGGRSLV